jgi:diguanylate cyclase (GGDEF)-like protein
VCAGFAAAQATLVVAELAAGAGRGWPLTVLDGVLALAFALLAALASGHRLSTGWQERLAVSVPLLAGAAAALRVGWSHESWAGAELILVAAAAVVAGARRPRAAWTVLGGAAALWAASFAAELVVAGGGADRVAAGALTGVLVIAAGALAAVVRQTGDGVAAELENLRRELAEQSVRDLLTGVANRRGLELVAQPMIDLARRQGHAVHCLVVDVDSLRGISAEHGHEVGDQVLRALAASLTSATRSTDVVARRAGDEFVVLGPGTGTSPLDMERRIRAHLSARADLPREAWQGRISAGSATLVPWDSDDLDGLLERAAQDMTLRRSLRRRAAARMRADNPADPVPRRDRGER